MNEALRGRVKTYIENNSFLEEDEKDTLLVILEHWPNSELTALEEAVKPLERVVEMRIQDNFDPRSSHGLDLSELRDRLENKTVNFSAKAKAVPKPKPRPVMPAMPPAHHQEALPAAHIPTVPPPATPSVPKPVIPRPVPKPPVAKPLPSAPAKGLADMPAVSHHVPEAVFAINTSKDLGHLTLAQMRSGAGFAANLHFLFEEIPALASRERTLNYYVIKEYGHSPLNSLFIETGLLLMDDESMDRRVAFQKAQEVTQARRGESLTAKEFELLSDFKEQLETLM